MSLLSKLLQKKNIEKLDDLSVEERATFEHYQSILEKEISVQTIKEFCISQIKLIEGKFSDNPKTDDDPYLKACLHVYLNIIKTIEAPEQERKALEQHLTALIK